MAKFDITFPISYATDGTNAYARLVDVSHYNNDAQSDGKIKFTVLAQNKIVGSIIKCTEGPGPYVDPHYASNFDAAIDTPTLEDRQFSAGSYHFFRPAQDPIKQAGHFVNHVADRNDQPLGGRLGLWVDVEVYDGVPYSTVAARLLKSLQEVENRTGLRPGIYTSAGKWKPIAPYAPWAKNYNLWAAFWPYGEPTTPLLPSGWSSWLFWQYTASSTFSGLGGKFDTNFYNGNEDQFYTFFGVPFVDNAPPPVPTTPVHCTCWASALNVRSGPGNTYKAIGSVYYGQTVPIYALHRGWARIDASASKWVYSYYLDQASAPMGLGFAAPTHKEGLLDTISKRFKT